MHLHSTPAVTPSKNKIEVYKHSFVSLTHKLSRRRSQMSFVPWKIHSRCRVKSINPPSYGYSFCFLFRGTRWYIWTAHGIPSARPTERQSSYWTKIKEHNLYRDSNTSTYGVEVHLRHKFSDARPNILCTYTSININKYVDNTRKSFSIPACAEGIQPRLLEQQQLHGWQPL